MASIPQSFPQNSIPNSQLSVRDILDQHTREIMLDFNCHHIGTIESFNPLLQTATASVNYVKTYFNFSTETQTYDPQNVAYPLIIDCPVMCLGGGGFSLTFPISEGDECLILFNDRDLDNWFNGSSSSANASNRLHAFSDAICLVGINSLPNVITTYNSDSIELRNDLGNTKVKVSDTDVTLYATGTNVVISPTSIVSTVGTCTVTQNATSVTTSVSPASTLVVNTTSVTASVGANTISLDASGATITISPGNILTVNSGVILAALSGGQFITISSASITASLGNGVTLELDSTGKIKVTNSTGELIAALNKLFTDIETGTVLGIPLLMPTFAADLAIFQSFKN